MKKFLTVITLSLALVTGIFAAPQTKPAPAEKSTTQKAAAPKATQKPAAAPVDDASINTAVQDKLAKTPSLKDTTITAATKEGTVTLTGKVKTVGAKGVATNVTKSVKGVKKVDNQLEVEKGGNIPKAKAKDKTPPATK